MKVIFLKKNGGNKRGDVKEAAEGYARNFLLPQGIAVLATPENLAKIKAEVTKVGKQQNDSLSAFKVMTGKINGKKVEIKGKANEAGKLYAAVSEADIKSALKRLGFDVGTARIVDTHQLKEAGDYKVKVDFGHSISSNIKVTVKI
jgi:large subunit ribosomal protein L9